MRKVLDRLPSHDLLLGVAELRHLPLLSLLHAALRQQFRVQLEAD